MTRHLHFKLLISLMDYNWKLCHSESRQIKISSRSIASSRSVYSRHNVGDLFFAFVTIFLPTREEKGFLNVIADSLNFLFLHQRAVNFIAASDIKKNQVHSDFLMERGASREERLAK